MSVINGLAAVLPRLQMCRVLILVPLVWWLISCSSRVIPPTQVNNPQTVWLMQYRIHSGLVFQEEEAGHLVMYEFGEWRWFAMRQDAWYRMFPVFLWSTPGSLSRRRIQLPQPFADERIIAAFEAEKGWPLTVERQRAQKLRDALARRYDQQRLTEHYDPLLDTWFVQDPLPYHALRTCTHVMAQWLTELGCSVEGWLWSWRWRVGPPKRHHRLR